VTRGKRIAAVLAGSVLVLGLVALAQSYGLGAGYTLEKGAVAAPAERVATLQRDPVKLRPWEEYADVLSRPLFNESRTPEAVEVVAADGGEEQAAPLNVLLTGVIITKDLRIAMVKDNESGKTQRVRVGQPLEGSQAGWKLIELKPRGAVFDGDSLGRQELELTMDTKGAPAVAPEAPAQPMVAAPPMDPNAAAAQAMVANGSTATPPPPAGQPANAEEIRRRIEERRRQLREEAQRMLEQQQQEQGANQKQ
jgi:general secretion pathway protein N